MGLRQTAMGRIVSGSALALAAMFMAPQVAQAACNMGQDAASFTAISFGKMRLSGFPAGSLTVGSAEADPDGDRWAFRLAPSSGSLIFAVTPKATPGLRLGATLHLPLPITGHIIERFAGGGCVRVISIDTGVLAGATLDATQSIFETPLGTRTDDLTGRKLQIQAQLPISDSTARTAGMLRLVAPQVALPTARVRLGGAGSASYVTRLQSTGPVVMDFDVNLLSVAFRTGTFAGGKFTAQSPGDLHVGSLDLGIASISGAKTEATYAGGAATVRASGLTVAYSKLDLSSGFTLAASGPSALTGGVLSGADDRAATDVLAIAPAGLSLDAGSVTLAAASFGLPGGATASGPTVLTFNSLSAKHTDIVSEISTPRLGDLFPDTLGVAAKRMTLTASGVTAAPSVSAQVDASAILLGAAKLSGQSIPLRIAFSANGDAAISLRPAAASLALATGPEAVSGQTSDLVFSANAPVTAGGGPRIVTIAPGALKGHLALPTQVRPRLGGQVSLAAGTFTATNPADVRLASDITGGRLSLGVATVSLKDPQLEPTPGGVPLILTSLTASKGSLLALSIAPADAGLKLQATFDLPGFDLKPPQPITSIKVTVGGLDVDITELKLGGVHVSIDPSQAQITLKDLALGLGKFAPHPAAAGEPEAPLQLSGEVTAPFSIGQTTGTFPLSATPIRLSALDIANAHFEAKSLSYSGPSNLKTTPASAVIDVASLHLPQTAGDKPAISATLALKDAPLSFSGAPNGRANVDSLVVKLVGDPSAPDGSIAMAIRNLDLSGRADIPLGTEPDGHAGCNLTVPANMSMPVGTIDGTLALNKGKASGTLDAANFGTGNINYSGHQDCRWNQHVVLAEITISYPCIGTWSDPIRTCHETIRPSFDMGMVFAFKAIDMDFQPKEVKYKLKANGGGEACHISLSRLFPKVRPVYSISPQLQVGGDIGQFINDIISTGVGTLETTFTAGALDLYSAMTLFGFGEANPVVDKCAS